MHNIAIESKQTAEQLALKAQRDLERIKIEACEGGTVEGRCRERKELAPAHIGAARLAIVH